MRRGAAAGLLASLLVVATPATPQALFPGAVESLSGLRLRAVLPSAQYGPGEPIAVYCTFDNAGPGPVALRRDAPITATLVVDGAEKRFPQERPCHPTDTSNEGEWVVLASGEHWTTCLTVRPPRTELLAGDHMLRVFCNLAPGSSPPRGVRAPSGVLASDPVRLKIRYKVLWMG